MKKIIVLLVVFITSTHYSQNQTLLDESWFVQGGSNATNTTWDNSMNTIPEVRTEITFLNDKMVIHDCCGGVFEMDVNYTGNNEIAFLNLNETQNPNCSPLGVYTVVKNIFSGMLNETIVFTIQNNPYEPGIKDIVFSHPANSSYVEFSNTPNEINDQAQAPYWGHEPPNHQWSLTHVTYQGQMMELPYGAAITIADIYEGTFTISLCGEIFVAINSSWELDVEVFVGPCFISCGILENTTGTCEPVAGYDMNYLETFKQNAYDFLNDNINQTMEYTFTFGSPSPNARKLMIRDFNLQNKLVFHSNPNYLSTEVNNLRPVITIYPNPVQEILHINQNTYQFVTATVYNLQGKKINRHILENSLSTIDVKVLTPGLYFLVLESENGERVFQKFVKQ